MNAFTKPSFDAALLYEKVRRRAHFPKHPHSCYAQLLLTSSLHCALRLGTFSPSRLSLLDNSPTLCRPIGRAATIWQVCGRRRAATDSLLDRLQQPVEAGAPPGVGCPRDRFSRHGPATAVATTEASTPPLAGPLRPCLLPPGRAEVWHNAPLQIHPHAPALSPSDRKGTPRSDDQTALTQPPAMIPLPHAAAHARMQSGSAPPHTRVEPRPHPARGSSSYRAGVPLSGDEQRQRGARVRPPVLQEQWAAVRSVRAGRPVQWTGESPSAEASEGHVI